jgi:RNA polymerase sigma factor (sigma-70 family)
MPDTAHELTRAIAAGDTEAFARFYEAWFERMYAEARRATRRDESFCLDVVQDAMMKVIRSMPVLETEAAMAAWLRRVVQRCAYDRLRAEARRMRREGAIVGGREIASDMREQIEWLRAELNLLDDESRHLLDLRWRLGWTLQRIGASLGLSAGAVDGRLSRIVRGMQRRAREQRDE